MPNTDKPAAAPAALPRAVVLLDRYGEFAEGAVLEVDADRLAQLDVEGAQYRPASETELRLANIRG